MDKQLISVREAAKKANVSGARIRQLLIEGTRLHGHKVGSFWAIEKTELDRWLRQRERK